jgi:hypothetical protein
MSMQGLDIAKDGKITQVITPTAGAAGTTDINSTAINMEGFEAALFIVTFGAITAAAVTSIKLQASDDDGSTDDYTDLAGTGQTIADSDDEKVFFISIIRPRKKWVRLVVDRGTQNAVVASAECLQYHGRVGPTTAHGTNVAGESHVSPAEGTA